MVNYMDEIIKDSIPIWDECIQTEFIQSLINNNLDEDKMSKYIIEDTRYLLNYAKCYAYLITKCNTLEEIRVFYDILSFVNEGETSIRREYLIKNGYNELDIETSIPDTETQIYIDHMMSFCANGSLVEGTMAILPCMLSYDYIFNKLYDENPNMLKNNKYKNILEAYIGDSVKEVCKAWASFANELMNKYPCSLEKCKQIFRFSSIREREFWNMSFNNKIEIIK